MFDKIKQTLSALQQLTDFQPRFGIILGTGLGNLVDDIQIEKSIPYQDIPNFPVSTVESHAGKLIFGFLNNQAVVVMAGRFHFYEGYSMQALTFPVRVLKFLGIEQLIISNVSGGTNEHYRAGDIVFLKDHIYLQPQHPLRGPNDDRLGKRFPDMSNIYNRNLNAKALKIAAQNNIRAHEGVYVCLSGPSLETVAEYVFINKIGGDMVGMSTIPEVIVAAHSELPVFVLSVISNQAYPPSVIKETTIEEVVALGKEIEPKMRLIVKELIGSFDQ